MAKANVQVVGVSAGNRTFRVASAATRFYDGEPLMKTPTYSSGAVSVNTVTPVTNTKPIIGTDEFVGVASIDASVNSSNTVTAQKTQATVLIPNVTIMRALASSTSAINTDAALILLLGNVVTFNLTSSVYTINSTATVNTAALTIVGGNSVKGTLDVTVDGRAYRQAVS